MQSSFPEASFSVMEDCMGGAGCVLWTEIGAEDSL